MGRGNHLWKCGCEVCVRFRRNPGNWPGRGHQGNCDVCGRADVPLVDYLPPLLIEFLGFHSLCEFCRNSINGYVGEGINTEGWKLCWQIDTDESLKWAMLDWLRNNHWHDAFKVAILGYTTREDAFFGKIGKDPEYRQYWMSHGNQRVRDQIVARFGK